MKCQKLSSGIYFGPRSRTPSRLKVVNRSLKKPRKHARFVSKSMKRIEEEVEKGQANMQFVLGNGRNRKNIGSNKDYGQSSNKGPSMMVINKLCKRSYSEKVHRGNHVFPQSKKHLLNGCKDRQMNPDAMKKDFPPKAISSKSWHAFTSEKLVKPTLMISLTSKMKQGCVDHANDMKMSSSQPKKLKAMPGLVHNPKERDRPLTWIYKRGGMSGCNDIDCGNLGSRKEPLLEEKTKSHDDSGSEAKNPTHRMMKRRRRYIETNEDEDEDLNGDQSPKGVADDSTRLTSEDDALNNRHDKVYMPFIADCLKKQCYCCSKPIKEPVWSGLLNIGNKEYMTLSGHLSTKSCDKVRNLSESLSRVVEVAKLPRSKVWPKRWDGSNPTNENIGLYFFPHKMRHDKSHDKLLKEVMENDLALRAIIGDVEMLMFASSLLPKQYQTFQMKHYFWGVFKPKEVEGKQDAAQHQLDRTTGANAFAANATATSVPSNAASIPRGATGVATDVASIPTEDATNASTRAGNHEQQTDSSSMGALSCRMFAFVVQQQTPRFEQLIREMQQEGALVMHGEMMSTRSWTGNMATTTQPGQPSKT